MLTMTRLPSDSFLPSGAALDPSQRSIPFGSLNDHASPSVISPLSLPHAIHKLNFLDDSTVTNLPSPNYLHSSVSAPPRPQQQLLSPRQSLPLPSIREQRSASLSPTRHRNRSGARPSFFERNSTSSMTSSESRDQERQSTEWTNLTNLLNRREEQARKLFENWQAERAQLEASRNRAEKLFEEERKMMNDERMMLLNERLQLKEDVENWQQRALALEKERDLMAGYIKRLQRKPANGILAFDGTTDSAICSIRGGGTDSTGTTSGSSSKLRTPSDRLSPGSRVPKPCGPTMPESQPFIPLDPRMQSLSPGSRSPTSDAKIPSIDIQEVIPSLEGIRVKADAVQKSTFTDGSVSPPAESKPKLSAPVSQPESNRLRTMPAATQEALQAPEAHRLTMHAGHTPNHSMSLSRLHTVESTQESTEVLNTASSSSQNSGAATPTHPLAEAGHNQAPEQFLQVQTAELDVALGPLTLGADTDMANPAVPPPGNPDDHVLPVNEDVEDQDDDPALKGPLFLRNLPAADEPFLQQLSEKLTMAKDNDLTPTVLKNDFLNPSTETIVGAIVDAIRGGNGANDADEEEVEVPEEEIPLRLKKTSNFGAPLGQLGK